MLGDAPLTVTVTAWFPPAEVEFAGVKVAVIWLGETKVLFETVMLGPAFTVAPEVNPDPFMVTDSAVLTRPWGGEIFAI